MRSNIALVTDACAAAPGAFCSVAHNANVRRHPGIALSIS
jgi:hypothetical protein